MRSRMVLLLFAGIGFGALANDEPNVDPGLPDAELLEFIGSWEGDLDEWQEFFDSLPVMTNEKTAVDGQDEQETGQ